MLGGSFNPPHESHRRIAAQALDQLPIQRLLAIPSGDHPHKQGRDMAPAEHRLEMAKLAFAGLEHVTVDDRELRRTGRSFTVDTLEELRAEHPERRLYFLIGSDNLPLLPTWHQHHRMLELATFVTWPRAGHPVDPTGLARLDLDEAERASLLDHTLDLPADDVAASDLRARLLIIGLAPGAHGANRTGRPFTGDAAGVLLYAALHRHGFANLPAATSREDGLALRDAGQAVDVDDAVEACGCTVGCGRVSGEAHRWRLADRSAPPTRVVSGLADVVSGLNLISWSSRSPALASADAATIDLLYSAGSTESASSSPSNGDEDRRRRNLETAGSQPHQNRHYNPPLGTYVY